MCAQSASQKMAALSNNNILGPDITASEWVSQKTGAFCDVSDI